MEEEARPALGPVASDMLRESKGLLLPWPALPPPEVICGSSDCEFNGSSAAGDGCAYPGSRGIDPSSPVPLELVLEEDPPGRGWDRVCFSCGHQGHGVSRCSRIDTLFPFLLGGWSVGVRNGRY